MYSRPCLLSDNLFTYIDGPTATLPEQNVSYHWVNIIGIYSNSISCEEKIYVASWGNLYEINVGDFYDDFINTNYVMIYD